MLLNCLYILYNLLNFGLISSYELEGHQLESEISEMLNECRLTAFESVKCKEFDYANNFLEHQKLYLRSSKSNTKSYTIQNVDTSVQYQTIFEEFILKLRC